ncbi:MULTISPECIES: sulfite oxidase [Kribbella]|jgi:DMSO/TMAO reductase YedYZ molybdopterin-dependent catalytic subunit|uniref:DMSO/TMAO reductase YedYZ molybdopterin-dependent catalytic subunit n=1 Tax=Kribbella pratensis TaxID=2512112 RepID=A0ABY2FR71_9ACTN|nr:MULTISPECIES: sulfite oxidase [Kribbella]TDW95279.1 DMSO/TMAO reductase YedYZ molybdopterin-dependent catalytic subunit [Kribbella pratensis]TDX03892.1 DMSO/TMAO reductase YedYZ molybdopterin-dependent catalytic subunit [Kribbella sp. VKM Ac-2566]
MSIEDFSVRGRLADTGEGITPDELQLAARNHGMPLEGLRYDVTPPGLHYVLVHYDIPATNAGDWLLSVDGCVEQPLAFGLTELRAMGRRTVRVTLECAGNGRATLQPRPISQPWLSEAVGTAEWTGVLLSDLLRLAGLRSDAVDVVFTGADHGVERGVEQDYQRGLSVEEAIDSGALVAWEMNGAPLPPQHGYPLRLVVPGWYGMASVKWLRSIEVIDHTFDGFQNAVAYRIRTDADDQGVAVTRIEPRALLIPPGFPDFMSRHRFVAAGPVPLFGRAWSGWAPIERVEVSTDAGVNWHEATLGAPGNEDELAWRGFAYDWEATPGEHVLTVRAYDASGREQPIEAPWNRGGFSNNTAQRITVLVT